MNGDQDRRLKEEQRHALRMVVKMSREQKWWEVGSMVGWTLMLAALALSHAWPTMLTMAAWGFFVFYVAPRANKRARENGWHEAWSQAFHLAMTREMPMEVCLEMVARAAAGMPSDKARLDEMRMSLRELDEELREE